MFGQCRTAKTPQPAPSSTSYVSTYQFIVMPIKEQGVNMKHVPTYFIILQCGIYIRVSVYTAPLLHTLYIYSSKKKNST